MKLSTLAARLPKSLALLPCLFLGACQSPPQATPIDQMKLIRELPRVKNSAAAPCRLQKEIAEQQSYLAAVEAAAAGKSKPPVIVAQCGADKPKATS
jgi:hypothetical protein